MYKFGLYGSRRQKRPNTGTPGEYLLLASEPAAPEEVNVSKHVPSFQYANLYLTRRRAMRRIRSKLRNQLHG